MNPKNSSFEKKFLPYFLFFGIGVAGYFAANWIFPGGTGATMQNLAVAVGWGGALLVGLIGLAVVYRMFNGTINLTQLISEPSGEASISRFQLLVFTFVIAISFILLTVSNQRPGFPEIPATVLALLGISAGSYIVSKGIQKDITIAQIPPTISVSPDSITAVPGQSVTFTASATGTGTLTYRWQRIGRGQQVAVDIPGQQQQSLRLTADFAYDGSEFQCKVSADSGEATSAPVKLHVQEDRG
ncbi:MAG: immunoglobulin domain-containing protein [Verrucomicrobia bacterium]|jgi:hypothetical protein|nr:immunoglobulin domain-containing protein [Verrucomicrobiota bacterium]